MTTRVLLDISRLLSRIRHATPTGVDRVEMAYARHLPTHHDVEYVADIPFACYCRLSTPAVTAFLDETERRWENPHSRAPGLAAAVRAVAQLKPLAPFVDRGRSVYVQTSPHHLAQENRVARILRRERARFVCLVHDLIPIEWPEYARIDGAALHVRRIRTIARHADGIITNSMSTAVSMQPWLDRAGRSPPIAVAHLGTQPLHSRKPALSGATGDARPYFICIGTIEPRKNHLLLLHIWRKLSETLGRERAPKLLLVGRRGWENEQVVDLLDRCPGLAGLVEEHSGLADADIADLLTGAAALLLPSFAEGFGMPVPEALAAGVPVICSDIASLREAGGDGPDYLDPLDGLGWIRLVTDHATDGPARQAQLRRIARWQAPSWTEHMRTVSQMIDALSGEPGGEHRARRDPRHG